VTPARIMLLVLVIGAGAVVLYGLFAADSQIKLPLMVSGFAVLGICAGLLGFALAGSAARLGRDGRVGWAMLVAFIGGLFVLGASGSIAAAIVLGILAAA